MRKFVGLLLIVLLGPIFLQCSKSTEPNKTDLNEPNRTPAQLTAAEQTLLSSTNRFGFKLFRAVNDSTDSAENIFISPLSVSYALGMTLNGANGPTFDSMAAVLEHAGLSLAEINDAYYNLTRILTAADPSVIFTIANSIWSRAGKDIQPDFVDNCQNYFDALVRVMDFPDPADSINQWVADNTNDMIKEVIRPPISDDIAMLLINAIYFKGDWRIPFDTSETHEGKFHSAGGGEVTCDFMYKDSEEDTTLRYYENDLFQAATVPYGDEGFGMTFFLPKNPYTVDDIVAQMNETSWSAWMGNLHWEKFLFYTPKFKLGFKVELKGILKAMGMANAFEQSADFSNMFVDGVGWIDQVKHQTYIQVDEKGTEAAAVTVVVMVDSITSPMILDRPFLFVVHEQVSGTILFMGKIAEPEWED
ncbi:MAG: serpin family protein [Candidatus Zixiibacteriota bacterium]